MKSPANVPAVWGTRGASNVPAPDVAGSPDLTLRNADNGTRIRHETRMLADLLFTGRDFALIGQDLAPGSMAEPGW